MRAIVWDWAWDDDYDDFSSFEPDAKAVRRLLPEPPLPSGGTWRERSEGEGSPLIAPPGRMLAGAVLFAIQCVAAFAVLFWLSRSAQMQGLGGIAWVVGLAVLFGGGAMAIWRFSATVYATPDIRRLASEIPRFDVFPVRIRIVQNKTLTGIDQGVAWFAKDALHFRGLESEFIIGAQDLRYDPLAIGDGHGALEKGWVMPMLALRHPDVSLSIVFQPMDRLDRTDKRDCGYRFRHHLRLFLRQWRGSRVDSVYPPLARQPGLAAKGRVAVQSAADAASKSER